MEIVLRQNNKLYYVEGKTLDHLIEKGCEQSNRLVIDIIGTKNARYLKKEIQCGFESNSSLQYLFLFKGKRLIVIDRDAALANDFENTFLKLWNKRK